MVLLNNQYNKLVVSFFDWAFVCSLQKLINGRTTNSSIFFLGGVLWIKKQITLN